MTRWFRMYDEVLDDPKVQRLPPPLFKAWVGMLCLASRHDGDLPTIDHIAFALRVDEEKATAWLEELARRGLIDNTDGAIRPHNWSARQFRGDRDPTASQRQARKRERDRMGLKAPNVTGVTADVEASDRDASPDEASDITPASRVTSHPPDTETDTEQKEAADAAPASGRRRELDELEERLLTAAGWPSEKCHDGLRFLGPILRLIEGGCGLDEDILPTVRLLARRKPDPPRSWAFFDRAILEAHAARMAPVVIPEAPTRGTGPPRSRADEEMAKQREIMARFDAEAAAARGGSA